MYIVYTFGMGAGKGQLHRVKAAYKTKGKSPKPKFNISDKVSVPMYVHKANGSIMDIWYDADLNICRYCVEINPTLHADYKEKSITLLKPGSEKDYRDYLHKTVTFQHRLDKWRNKPGVKKYDDKKGHVTAVKKLAKDDTVHFRVHFEGDQGTSKFSFSREDFKPIELKVDIEQLNAPAF